ncbi:MAG TPA: hypothetical protein VHM02_01210 [Thermoanaerobaculia bacterium]|nr:hypothetical protein [Thermoanaerobaculia bacterium]
MIRRLLSAPLRIVNRLVGGTRRTHVPRTTSTTVPRTGTRRPL